MRGEGARGEGKGRGEISRVPTLALTVGVGTVMDAREESREVNRRKGPEWGS